MHLYLVLIVCCFSVHSMHLYLVLMVCCLWVHSTHLYMLHIYGSMYVDPKAWYPHLIWKWWGNPAGCVHREATKQKRGKAYVAVKGNPFWSTTWYTSYQTECRCWPNSCIHLAKPNSALLNPYAKYMQPTKRVLRVFSNVTLRLQDVACLEWDWAAGLCLQGRTKETVQARVFFMPLAGSWLRPLFFSNLISFDVLM
jgi:hypothetical protein